MTVAGTPQIKVGRLTTHVLDVRLGQPARGLAFTLFRIVGTDRLKLTEGRTNDDGRAANPLLEGEAMVAGLYELGFAVGAYQAHFLEGDAAGFYDIITIRFRIGDVHAHYHVPLLLSPFGYSTYRGS
jgi:5-hydroxyisourate hydrolase